MGIHRAHAISPKALVCRQVKTSGSASKWVGVDIHSNISDAIEHLKGQDFEVWAADLHPAAIDYRQVDYTRRVAVVLGAERDGITAEARSQLDRFVTIPMQGLVHSLNVSVAGALILFEAQRQRQAAGLYDQVQLSPDTIHTTLVEWLHPRVASYCRSRGLAYPALNEEGEIEGEFRP